MSIHCNIDGRKTPKGAALAFLAKIAAFEGTECLIWPFSRNAKGYAKIGDKGRGQYVSRIVCAEKHGQRPTPNHEAAHSCGRGGDGCVSPHHISWKTPKDNQADRLTHGTTNRGSRNGRAKLNESMVAEIRKLKGSVSQRAIAKQFGISQSSVREIFANKNWGWLS